MPSALAGIGTVFVAGYLAKLLLEPLLPSTPSSSRLTRGSMLILVAMLVVTVSPWAIMFSRTGFEGHVGQFFLALSILCVCLSKKRPALIFLAPIFGAAATYAYFSVRFVWLVIFVAAVDITHFSNLQNWQSKIGFFIKQKIIFILLPLLFYGLLLLPMLRSPLYNDANTFRLGTDSVLNKDYSLQVNVDRQLAGNTRIDRVLFNQKTLMLQELLKNYAANTSPNFMFVNGDPNLRHGTTQHGLFLLIFLPFFVYGLLVLFQRSKLIFLFLILWWLVALLPASVPENVPHALRSLNALVPLSLIITFGLANVITSFQRKLESRSQHTRIPVSGTALFLPAAAQ